MKKLTEEETRRTRKLIASDSWIKSLYNDWVYKGTMDIETALYTVAKNFCITKNEKG